jgi:mannose-1-phosphate guanylyltransferase
MVLAAGLGTRLRPLTETCPKALIDVGGRPMIEYPLRLLAAAGVEEVIVNLHHLGSALRAALGDGSRFGVALRYSPEDPILDTGGAIAQARPFFGEEPFVVANCDALMDLDLPTMWQLHQRFEALATLAVREDPDAERYGALDLDASGRVRRMLGKPHDAAEPLARRMFCGAHLISPAIFSHFPKTSVFSITRDVYVPLVEAGEALYGFDHRGYWRDLGTIDSLSRARADVAAKRFHPAYLKSY